MNTKTFLKICFFCVFNIVSVNSYAWLIPPPPFECDGFYYRLFDSEKPNEVEVSFAKNNLNIPDNEWYSIYSGVVRIPSTIEYDNTTYTVTRIGEKAFMQQDLMTAVVIPNTIECIDEFAFSNCTGLRTVTFMPNSNLKRIEMCAFGPPTTTALDHGGCTSLKTITLPNSLTYIGRMAFCQCTSLNNITFGNSIDSIDTQAFHHCDMLTEVNLSAKHIGSGAFGHCVRLNTINLAEGVELIDQNAFWHCYDLQNINLPNTLSGIGDDAFYNCYSLESVEIPNSVVEMGMEVFMRCESLKNIVLSESLIRIPIKAFANTSIQSVTIPNSVTVIGGSSFADCPYLQTVHWGTSVTSINTQAFENDALLSISNLPEKINYIGDFAFHQCTAITEITIPSTTEQIRDGAFRECTNLKNVYCLCENPPYSPYNSFAFEQCDCPVTVHVYTGKKSVYEQSYDWNVAIQHNTITIIDDIQFQLVESITFNNAPYYCELYGEGQATATVLPVNAANRNLEWSSSDESVLIFIDDNGGFFGVGEGAVTITATATDGSGVSASATVYVGQGGPAVKEDQTLSMSSIPTMTYGASNYSLPSATEQGLTITWSSSKTSVATISNGNKLVIRGAGTATITASQAGNDDYNPFEQTFTLTVNKAQLTITADDKSMTAGENVPDLTFTCSGFVNGESSSVMTQQPTVTTTANSSSPAGTYPITVSGANAANYYITYVDGTLTVVAGCTLGDVNGDDEINGFDIVYLVDIIMGNPSFTFDFAAADLDGDGEINGFDLVELVDLILSQPVSGAKARRAPEMMSPAMNTSMLMSGKTDGSISVGVDSGESYILSQFMLELSDGQQLTDITSSDRRHVVAYRAIDDNRYAVLCYSARNAVFTDSRDMLTVSCEGSGTVRISDVMLVDADKKPHYVRDAEFSEATGIELFNGIFSKPSDIYSIFGTLVRKNAKSINGLGKGIYIHNGKTIIIK